MNTDVSEEHNAFILRVYTEANGQQKTFWNVRTHLRKVAENYVSPKRQHLSKQTSHPWRRCYRYTVLRKLRISLHFSLFISFANNIRNLNSETDLRIKTQTTITLHYINNIKYVGHLESKERLRIQPAQLFNFSWWVMWCVQ